MSGAINKGFSLMELMVVVGILILLSTIGIAAFQNSNKINRLSAAESAVAGAIRDARTAARTTGNPVLVHVATDTNGTTSVSGVARLLIWHAGFAANDFADGSDRFFMPPPAASGFSPTTDEPTRNYHYFHAFDGVTGAAFRLSDAATTDGSWPIATLYEKNSTVAERGNRARQLVRSATQPAEGFVLRCLVRAPAWTEDCQPLVILSGETPPAPGTNKDQLATPTMDGSLAGLILRPIIYETKQSSHGGPITSKGWDLIGWVTTEVPPPPLPAPQTPTIQTTTISACEDNRQDPDDQMEAVNAAWTTPGPAPPPPPPPAPAPVPPVVNPVEWITTRQRLLDWQEDQWKEVSLLFDGKTISLQIDGRQATISRAVAGRMKQTDTVHCSFGFLADVPPVHRYLRFETNHWSPDDENTLNIIRVDGTTMHFSSQNCTLGPKGRIGAVTILRLAETQSRPLPPGIQVQGTAEYTIMPSGEIITAGVAGTSQTAPSPITLRGVFAEQDDQVVLTINPSSGHVDSSILPSRSAPSP